MVFCQIASIYVIWWCRSLSTSQKNKIQNLGVKLLEGQEAMEWVRCEPPSIRVNYTLGGRVEHVRHGEARNTSSRREHRDTGHAMPPLHCNTSAELPSISPKWAVGWDFWVWGLARNEWIIVNKKGARYQTLTPFHVNICINIIRVSSWKAYRCWL